MNEKIQINKTWVQEIGAYFLVTFAAVCAYKVLIYLHISNMDQLVAAAYGVIEGKPHWLAYQNRLLGPYLVLMISEAGFSFKEAWAIYHALFLQAFSVLIFYLLRREGISIRSSMAYLVIVLFGFIVFQDRFWFYTWDSIDLIVFALFSYGVIKSLQPSYFVIIFFLAILNRETALFIPAYLILQALYFEDGKVLPRLRSISGLVLGAVLLVGGMAYTKLIRHALFISKNDGSPDTRHELIGNHIYLMRNLETFFVENLFSLHIFVSVFVLGTLLYFFLRVREMKDYELKSFLIILALTANIFIFGLVNETRMWFIVFPFLLFLFLSLDGQIKPRRPKVAGT